VKEPSINNKEIKKNQQNLGNDKVKEAKER
jgi:hypothetical protein